MQMALQFEACSYGLQPWQIVPLPFIEVPFIYIMHGPIDTHTTQKCVHVCVRLY